MELVFMIGDRSPLNFDLIRLAVKTGLIFSHRMNAVAAYFIILKIYVDRENLPDAMNIKYYAKFYSEHPNAHSEEDLILHLKNLKTLKNKPRTSKEELIKIGQYEKLFKAVKADVDNGLSTWVSEYKLDALARFNKERALHIYNEKGDQELGIYLFQKTILEELSSPDFYHFFCTDKVNPKEYIMQKYDGTKSKLELIFSTRLCLLPDLDSLTYAQLNIIRNDFHELLKPFYKTVATMKEEFDATTLTPENIEELDKRFDELIDPYLPLFEEYVTNNIYFQQIKNSDANHKTYELNIEFATVKTLVLMYKQLGVISEAEETDLLEKIALKRDLNSLCVFFLIGEIKD